MQVYIGMDIGTAKPTPAEQSLVPHHQIDLVYPDQSYSAGQYARDAETTLRQIWQRQRMPVLVGGSGLYYRAVVYGLDEMPQVPAHIRQTILQQCAEKGSQHCFEELQKIDPQTAQRLHPNDTHRVTRALEIFAASGKMMSQLQKMQDFSRPRFPALIFAYTEERAVLYERINLRTEKMLQHGWIEEVSQLRERYDKSLLPMQALGYAQIHQYLDGVCSYDETRALIQQKTRNFAKRQLTWFRKEAHIQWISRDQQSSAIEKAESFCQRNFAKID
jgi:tRNA dimethylallyltransferase